MGVARCENRDSPADPVYTFHEVTVVDILFRNFFGISHAIHLHGHDVYVVARSTFVEPTTGQPSVLAPLSLAALGWSMSSLGNLSQLQYCSFSGVLNHSGVMPEMFNVQAQVWQAHGIILGLLCEQWSCDTDVSRFATVPVDTSQYFPTDLVWVQPRGWTVIRVKLNNPGIWPFHCHQQLHVLKGMMVAVDVMPERQAAVPKELLRNCRCSDDTDNDTIIWISVALAIVASILLFGSLFALKRAHAYAATLEVQIKQEVSAKSSPPWIYSGAPQQTPYDHGTESFGTWKL